jgi:glucose-6-phosphate isomerase
VTDQHSQLQLYLEGPNDKLVTIIEDSKFDRNLKIPDSLPKARELDYLRGKTMNKLIAAERKATTDALRDAKRPVIRVTLPQVNAHTLGQLMHMLEVETAMAGQLLGVNAFDQPAVESIKVLTRKYLGVKR